MSKNKTRKNIEDLLIQGLRGCSIYYNPDVKNNRCLFNCTIKSFDLRNPIISNGSDIKYKSVKIVVQGNTYHYDFFSVDFMEKDPFVLKINDKKLKVNYNGSSFYSPLFEIEFYLHFKDSIFRGKEFKSIKNRWEILDL